MKYSSLELKMSNFYLKKYYCIIVAMVSKTQRTNKNKKKSISSIKSEIRFKDDSKSELYGTVSKELGACSFTIELLNGDTKYAVLTGTLKKRMRIKVKDIVLLEPTDDGTRDHYQILFKYNNKQISILKRNGELKKEQEIEKEENDYVFEGEEKEKDQIREIDEDFIDNL